MAFNLAIDDRSAVTVELDVFSGRPNPVWTLGPDVKAKLFQLLRANEDVAGRPEAPPGLGYRGFIVRIASKAREDVLRVGSGQIELTGQLYRDADRVVERYLVNSMPDVLRSQFEAVLPK